MAATDDKNLPCTCQKFLILDNKVWGIPRVPVRNAQFGHKPRSTNTSKTWFCSLMFCCSFPSLIWFAMLLWTTPWTFFSVRCGHLVRFRPAVFAQEGVCDVLHCTAPATRRTPLTRRNQKQPELGLFNLKLPELGPSGFEGTQKGL